MSDPTSSEAQYKWRLPPGFPPPAVPADNPMSDAKVALGCRLFFETRLSATHTYSCASCHRPELAFTDGRALAIGAQGDSMHRSAMTLTNVAYNPAFTWASERVVTLERQMEQPLFNEHPLEMGLKRDDRELLAWLGQEETYATAFHDSFPTEAEPITMPAEMPFVTVFLLLVMSAIVAGIVEEAAFRGYMQGPIERRYGPAVAILINGVVFGLAHYNHHPTSVLVMLPFYVGVSAVYGGLTSATNSILPGVVLHAGGDVFTLARMWTAGKSEWQLSAAAPRLIWETGVDFTFLWSVTVFVVLGASTVWAYSALARTAREREDSIGTFDRK